MTHTIEVGGTACLRGRNITLDRYFTSLSVSEWCLKKNITITGTLRSDRKGIPKEMKTDAGREFKSTKWCYNDKKMPISYADKKNKGTKIVLALTTMHDEMRVSKDKRKKPEPLVYYDHMKGGVDVIDLVSIRATTRAKTERWTLNANWFLCDTVKTNAKTLYNEINGKNLSNFEFTWNLGKELVTPFIKQRSENPFGLQTSVLSRMKRVLGPDDRAAEAVPPKATGGTEKGYCKVCLDEIAGPHYTTKRKKLNNKWRYKCMVCGDSLCTSKDGHCYYTCENVKTIKISCSCQILVIYVVFMVKCCTFYDFVVLSCSFPHHFQVISGKNAYVSILFHLVTAEYGDCMLIRIFLHKCKQIET